MKNAILSILVLLSISACEQREEPVPIPTKPTDYTFKILSGNNQEGYFRHTLAEPIVLEASETISKIDYRVIEGNGEIYYETVLRRPGNIDNYFLLGCSEKNVIRAYFYYSSNNILVDSVDIVAKAKPHPVWNRSCGTIIYKNPGFDFAYIYSIKKHPNGIIYAIGDKLYRSSDSGKSWEIVESFPHQGNAAGLNSLEIAPNGKIFVGTRNNGMSISEDNGSSWNYSNNGITNLYSLSKTFAINDNLIITKSYVNNTFLSKDGGRNWQLISIGGDEIVTLVEVNGVLFLLKEFGSLIKSLDNGMSWELMEKNSYLTALATDGNGNLFKVIGRCEEKTVFRSTDLGVTWTQLAIIPDVSPHGCSDVADMKVRDNIIYLTDEGKLYKIDGAGNVSVLNQENKEIRAMNILLLNDNKIIIGADGLYYN